MPVRPPLMPPRQKGAQSPMSTAASARGADIAVALMCRGAAAAEEAEVDAVRLRLLAGADRTRPPRAGGSAAGVATGKVPPGGRTAPPGPAEIPERSKPIGPA